MCPASPPSSARSSCSAASDRSGWGVRASIPDLARSSGPSQAPAAPSPLLRGPAPPRILQRGECSHAAAALPSPAVRALDPPFGAPMQKSIIVRPSPESKLPPSGAGDGWTVVKSRKERHAPKNPSGRSASSAPRRSGRRSSFNGQSGRDAFLRRFRGLCFRCLSSRHQRIDCRDPLHCIIYRLPGHFGRDCPKNPKSKRGRGVVKGRLGPLQQRGSVKDRLCFPTPDPPPPPAAMDRRAFHTDPSRRPRVSHKVVITTPAMEHQEFLLRKHAVLLSTTAEHHAANPMAVGRAIEEQMRTPPHLLRVTSHDPEDFFVHFELPGHKENAVRLGSIMVDGVVFSIKGWCEDDHDVPDDLKLHVRVVIERMPMQMWSLEGAEVIGDKCIVDRLDSRTLERGHTRTFACWVWVPDVAFVPTKCIIWRAARGAGRVEAMLGFSPPNRQVAPPLAVKKRELLLHVDRVEDWTLPSPRSSHSRQSGLPSSGSDDDAPFPAIYQGTWTRHVEDGQGRHTAPAVTSTGCQGLQLGGGRRDHDDRDGDRSGRRSWKYTLLGRSHGDSARRSSSNTKAPPPTARHRSRTPTSHRHGKSHATSDTGICATPPLPLHRRPSPPPPPPPSSQLPHAPQPLAPPEQDPVAVFFNSTADVIAPPPRPDSMQL